MSGSASALWFQQESIQGKLWAPGWCAALSSSSLTRTTWRLGFSEKISFSRLYQCWTLTVSLTVTIDVLWLAVISIAGGRRLRKLFIRLSITLRSSSKRAMKREEYCCSVTCTGIPGSRMSLCTAVTTRNVQRRLASSLFSWAKSASTSASTTPDSVCKRARSQLRESLSTRNSRMWRTSSPWRVPSPGWIL